MKERDHEGWLFESWRGTLEIRVADCVFNGDAIISRMREAAEQGVRLLVLPELCVTGYTCGDLFLQDCLLNGAVEALHRIVQASAEMELLTVVGLPLTFEGKLYNCAAVVFRGGVLGIVPKTNLPNYGEFYEERHFTPAPLQNGEIVLLGERTPLAPNFFSSAPPCRNLLWAWRYARISGRRFHPPQDSVSEGPL